MSSRRAALVAAPIAVALVAAAGWAVVSRSDPRTTGDPEVVASPAPGAPAVPSDVVDPGPGASTSGVPVTSVDPVRGVGLPGTDSTGTPPPAGGGVAVGIEVGAGTGTGQVSTPDPRPTPVPDPGSAQYAESAEVLAASLSCSAGVVAGAAQQPVLLVPGTFYDPDPNWSVAYYRALELRGTPYCTVTLPTVSTGDAQTSGERVAYAIRTVSAITGGQVDVLGYSQGGMLPRWAFKYFPDTRDMVDDFVALSPTNRGTLTADLLCSIPAACQPAVWQQQTGSAFLTALNAGGETFAGIDYTVVYTTTDEIAAPNFGSFAVSPLRTGDGRVSNVAIQEVCPLDLSEHFLIGSSDHAAYALFTDALDHDGPADPARVDRAVCVTPHPGVDPVTGVADQAAFVAAGLANLALQPRVLAEPPLRSYAAAG